MQLIQYVNDVNFINPELCSSDQPTSDLLTIAIFKPNFSHLVTSSQMRILLLYFANQNESQYVKTVIKATLAFYLLDNDQ